MGQKSGGPHGVVFSIAVIIPASPFATVLFLSTGTVRKHVDNIYAKLGVTNRTAAVSRAYGVTSPPADVRIP